MSGESDDLTLSISNTIPNISNSTPNTLNANPNIETNYGEWDDILNFIGPSPSEENKKSVDFLVNASIDEGGGKDVDEGDDESGQNSDEENSTEEEIRDEDYEQPIEDYCMTLGQPITWPELIEDSDLLLDGATDEVDVESNINDLEDDGYPVFNPAIDMKNPIFHLRMVFASKKVVKEALREYAIKNGRQIRFVKNDKRRIRVICQESCPFLFYASVMEDKIGYQIKKLIDEHDCQRVYNNKRIDAKWLAERYKERFRSEPGTTCNGFIDQVKDDFESEVSRWKFYRTRATAMKMIEGDIKDQYALLWDYCEELKRSNPGSTIVLHSRGVNEFWRLYCCFSACKNGFNAGCRPLIGLDGCFLKGYYEGILLSAVGIDANNCMFPIAYAVVDSENKENWEWFVEILKEDLQMNNSLSFTFISDRQKGLLEAVKKHAEDAEHRFCVRHMYNNFKTKHPSLTLKEMVWAAARTTTIPRFQQHMATLGGTDATALAWFSDKPTSAWSRSHFRTRPKCDILLNNLCEAFNKSILPARDSPIIVMLERIKNYMMERMVDKRKSMEKWKYPISPKAMEIIAKNQEWARFCRIKWSGELHFQVGVTHTNEQYVVDLNAKTCACRKWELTGIPCVHALACILKVNLNPISFVDAYYSKQAYEKTYAEIIKGTNGPESWPNPRTHPLQPPLVKKRPGRPKKARNREAGEVPASNKVRKFGTIILLCKKMWKAWS
ncbi:uncharacterized protein LOC115704296 [Cannabis sativa]|uniref:uncharacterized protein LOC115704296 n=1 Tax=Cannabis sativa TaxID=3483 RepID=UPI0029CA4132|nr:uncharacterized protein LOC115704296 [Cannabis sativa]